MIIWMIVTIRQIWQYILIDSSSSIPDLMNEVPVVVKKELTKLWLIKGSVGVDHARRWYMWPSNPFLGLCIQSPLNS